MTSRLILAALQSSLLLALWLLCGCGGGKQVVIADPARVKRLSRPVDAWVAYDTAPGSEVFDENPTPVRLEVGDFIVRRRAQPASRPAK